NFWVYTGAGDTNPIPDLRDDPEAEDEDFYRRDNGYPRWNSSFRERMQGLVDFLNPELVVVLAANDRCTEDGDCRERCLTSAEIGNDGDRICYNWGGVANSGLGFTVGNEGDPNLAQMLIHEVGHAYFELGDEYGVRGTKNCTDDDAISRAERYNNLTLNTDEVDDGSDEATEVHWSSQITIDEPEADFDTYMSYGYDFSAMEGEVSTFIGGGTCRRKLKRGQLQCRMHSHPDYTWCEVCDRLVEEKFDEWQESAGEVCPSRWRDDGICDRCLGDDPDCCGIFELRCRARRVTCGDGTCNPLFGETLDTCLDDCAPNECGDGVCEGTEDDETCADDCGCASVDRSSDITPLGCFCGPDCTDFGDCCADSCQEFGNGC
ncbi:MAG: M64 family metallopeptidase, partial [Deltaproteobacteria bacterium]|nr:M64 family metallopeptidase [Deltaproteobacteria bacterium]